MDNFCNSNTLFEICYLYASHLRFLLGVASNAAGPAAGATGALSAPEEKPGLKVPKKDNRAVSDLSILNLAKAAGYSAKLYMLLNIPSATILRERAAAEESIRGVLD